MRRITNKNRANSPTPVPSPRQTPGRVQVQPSNQLLIPMVQVSPSTPRSSFAMPGGGSSGRKDKSGKSEKEKSGKSGHSHHHHGLERSRSGRHANWSFIEESGRASRDLISQLSGSTVFTTDEINRLGRRFRKLDSDLSGALSMDEFLSMPEIRQNPMARRVVQTFDNDRNGSVDFREFVLGMSQFSMKGNQEARLRFAFRIYDIDNDGKISNGELFQVVKMMVGDNLDDVQVQQIVDHTMWQANKDGRGVYNSISFKQFVTLVQQGAGSSIHKTMVVTGL